ncbi:hypothetical protein MNBD_GAMMA25-2127 [hydrothermal vent metagenome]|uniref:Uncharacterized protein n=1 Tax=hydrothermal vent metagenome TaxID=652676 RepID=A0A3B1B067_9ZZZZ
MNNYSPAMLGTNTDYAKVKKCKIVVLILSTLACYFFSGAVFAASETLFPMGRFNNYQCIQCHEKTNAKLINGWRKSQHARNNEPVSCIACHGNSHDKAAVNARQDEICIACHGGKKNPVVHSYATSKHGLILKLENKGWDWTQPLSGANYRTPGCAYCHMHAGEHNISSAVRGADLLEKNTEKLTAVEEAMRRVCQDCHAPRYITRLFDNGERMLEIARMKVREAEALLSPARKQYSQQELNIVENQYQKMQSHLKNVYLGIAHQSSDYQWWHGHPALDGDLLRIKGILNKLARKKNLNTAAVSLIPFD